MYNYMLSPLEQSIQRLYERLAIREPHQLDADAIADKLNIWIHYAPFTSRAMDRQGLQTIVLDSRTSRAEQWQDFGHELCHLLHHAGNQLGMNESFIRFQETKADNFAFHFCIPTFMLLQTELPSLESEAVAVIASRFGVTLAFSEKRLGRHRRQIAAGELAARMQVQAEATELFKRKNKIDYVIPTGSSGMLYCRERGVVGYWRESDETD